MHSQVVKTRWNWFVVLATLVIFTVSCGGGSTILDPDPNPNPGPGNNQVPEGTWQGTVALNSGSNPGFNGVPDIPIDGQSGTSAVSAQERLGNEYLQKHNAEVDGTKLVLAAPDGEGDGPIAYGLYSFTGLAGVDPLYLNVECMPREFGEEYWVLLADFTVGDWRWFGPVTLPEFQLDMSDLNHRFITELGNMYFMVLCGPGNGATLSRSVLTFEDGEGGGGEGDLPGAPHHLMATDGTYEVKVVVEWMRGEGAESYELWRHTEGHEWALLAETEGNRYEDMDVDPEVVYWYKARSINVNGHSEFSNEDSGYAGRHEGDPDPGQVFHLQASKGEYYEKIKVWWQVEGPYDYFEVWRRTDGTEGEFELVGTTEATEFFDTELPGDYTFIYKARTVLGEHFGPWSNTDYGFLKDRETGVGHPFDLVASDGLYPDKVRVEWNMEGEYHHFLLYRKPDIEGTEWSLIGDPIHPEFNDYEVEPGAVYWYKVIAVLGEQQSEPSNHDDGYASESEPDIPAPFHLEASKGVYPDKVMVTWQFEGEYGYFEVWRRVDGSEGDFDLIGTTEAKHYADLDVLPDATYIYKARAVLHEATGPFSNTDYGFVGDRVLPGQPFGLVATDGTYEDKVRLEWNIEGEYGGFLVYRKLEGHEWDLLGDSEVPSYNDFAVDPGVVYIYKVVAVLGEHQSEPSNTDSGYAAGGGTQVGQPFELFASDGTYTDKVRVEWSIEGDYHHFLLYRKPDIEGTEWTLIADPVHPEYDDFGVEPGAVYWYKVIAVLGEQQSDPSNQDDGYAGEGGTHVGQPFELVASDGLYPEKIRVEWSIEGAYHHFLLYRRPDGEGTEWTLRADPLEPSFDDFEITPGAVYWYKVIAVLGEEQSEPSNHDSGYAGDR